MKSVLVRLALSAIFLVNVGCVTSGVDDVQKPEIVATSPGSEASGHVDKRGVTQALRRHGPSFQACYETQLKLDVTLAGKLVVEFTINRRGRVGSATIIKDELDSSILSKCVVSVLTRISFPAPVETVTITNSFVFSPSEEPR